MTHYERVRKPDDFGFPERDWELPEDSPDLDSDSSETVNEEDSIPEIRLGVRGDIVRDIGESLKDELVVFEKSLEAMGIGNTSDIADLKNLGEMVDMKTDKVINIYLYKLARNQKLFGKEYLQSVSVKDLIDVVEKKSNSSLTAEQNEQSANILSALGFDEYKVKYSFEQGGDKLAQQLRLTGWLTNQPFMTSFNKWVAARAGSEGLTFNEMFTEAKSRVVWECFSHIENKHKNYSLDQPSELSAYIEKTRTLKGLAKLCKHVFDEESLVPPTTSQT